MSIKKRSSSEAPVLDSESEVGSRAALAKYWREAIAPEEKRQLAKRGITVITFDQEDRITGHYHVGPAEMKAGRLVRSVFGPAIAKDASYIAIGRSQPTDGSRPAGEVIEQARYLQNAADFLGVNLADYTLFGSRDCLPVLDIVNGCHCHQPRKTSY